MAREITPKPIHVESMFSVEGSPKVQFPYVQRIFIEDHKPKGLKSGDVLPYGGTIVGVESRDAVINNRPNGLSLGEKKLLKGLLEYGGVAQFGPMNDSDMGVDYEHVFKKIYTPEIIEDALKDLAQTMQEDARTRGLHIDGVLAPEQSAVMIGAAFSTFLEDKPCCIPIQKNAKHPSELSVAVDSYTNSKGKTDIMSFPMELLDDMAKKNGGNEINLVLLDDILDTGTMTKAMALLLQMAREKGYKVNLIGVVAPLEKMYTEARKTIANEVGNMPVYSALAVEDMGIYKGTDPWIKVRGVDEPFACGIKDFRTPTQKAGV